MWRAVKASIEAKKKVLIAVSGGMDSVFLLDLVSRCKVEFEVGYFNHGDRPKESDLEEKFVRGLAENYNTNITVGYGVDLCSGSNIEQRCREQRYAFLTRTAKERGMDFILTAHHQQDQIETIFLRLMMGHAHDNLTMKQERDNIFRPLLNISKANIVKQVRKKNLQWLEDSSNFNTRFDRSWLRNEIIPQLNARRNLSKSMAKGLEKANASQ